MTSAESPQLIGKFSSSDHNIKSKGSALLRTLILFSAKVCKQVVVLHINLYI